jgi:hypothetical protein
MNISFSVGFCDDEGDCFDDRIFLWFDDACLIPVKRRGGLREMIENLERIENEINENYGGS